ncbi:hypothetical protein [uncultured Ruegeria sp.]|uniref:hypothetical protein n=1 Tax=uncultured Ruegeria sp. TaxID=259304 RepID=UPI002639CEB3|nr:hypothetical protein [uncultured Ruegeria sp.]
MITTARILGTAMMTGMIATAGLAQTSEDKTAPESFLFVQHADMATFAGTTLTLEGADNSIVVFTDRPHRAASTIPVSELVTRWGEGDDSFAADPPNAALVGETEDGKPVSLIVEITDPALSDGAMSYQYKVIKGDEQTSIENPYVVIDGSTWTLWAQGFANDMVGAGATGSSQISTAVTIDTDGAEVTGN